MNTMEARLFIARFVSRDYTPGEYEAFLRWLDEAPLDEVDQLIGAYESLYGQWPLGAGPSAGWAEQMEQKLDLADAKDERMQVRKLAPVRPVKKLVRLFAAACVLGLVLVCAYFYVNRSGPSQGSPADKTETLSILSTPKGRTGSIQLADGSKVWLNAASTLRYPSTFTGKEREVELTGEALFEIAPDAARPFRVRSGNLEVEVLGTQFDIMTYTDEPINRISLLEGSVKILRGSGSVDLQTGDQAEMENSLSGNSSSAMRIVHGIDAGSILAWRDGYMQFNNADLQTVMREVARSYDFEVKYEGKIAERFFTGKFSRKEDIHQILKILELQHVHFKINGKVITVLP